MLLRELMGYREKIGSRSQIKITMQGIIRLDIWEKIINIKINKPIKTSLMTQKSYKLGLTTEILNRTITDQN